MSIKTPPMQHKVFLPIVDGKGNRVSKNVVDEIIEEYDTAESGENLSEYQRERMQRRGEILDYQKTVLQMVKRARDSNRGMDYNEIEQIRPLVEKLNEAGTDGAVLLEESEFKTLCEKVKMPYVVAYSEIFDAFVQSILGSEKVKLAEVVNDVPDAG